MARRPDSAYFLRRPATFVLAEGGRLVPSGRPLPLEPTRDETYLDRDLARLVGGSDEAIVAFASHHGVLALPRTGGGLLETGLGWFLDQAGPSIGSDIKGLRRWVAMGTKVDVQPSLAPMAHILAATAAVDPPILSLASQLAGSRRGLTVEESFAVIRIGWDLFGQLFSDAGSIIAQRSQAEPVRVDLPAGASLSSLQLVYGLAETLAMAVTRSGGISGRLNPGWLGRLLVFVNGLPGADRWPLFAPEQIADWRAAANELATWQRAAHLLKSGRTWERTKADPLGTLARLRSHAGMPDMTAEGGDLVAASIASPDAYRTALSSLLTVRLQQSDAWPRPSVGEPAGTLARALWTIWPRVAGRQPARRCAWTGCSAELPEDSHGNQRYCEFHQGQAQRDRARRNRERRRSRLMPAAPVDAEA